MWGAISGPPTELAGGRADVQPLGRVLERIGRSHLDGVEDQPDPAHQRRKRRRLTVMDLDVDRRALVVSEALRPDTGVDGDEQSPTAAQDATQLRQRGARGIVATIDEAVERD